MTVLFHPQFPQDLKRYSAAYNQISPGLAFRFRLEIDESVQAVKQAPTSAGHFVNLGSKIVPAVRRRNLRAFPFFILYGVVAEQLIFGAIIPSRSDPLTWLTRFQEPPK